MMKKSGFYKMHMNVYDNIVSYFVLQYLLLDHIWWYWIPKFDSCWFHLVYLEFCFWAPTTLFNPYKTQHPSSIYLKTNSIQFQTCPWQHFAFCRQVTSILYTNIYRCTPGVYPLQNASGLSTLFSLNHAL